MGFGRMILSAESGLFKIIARNVMRVEVSWHSATACQTHCCWKNILGTSCSCSVNRTGYVATSQYSGCRRTYVHFCNMERDRENEMSDCIVPQCKEMSDLLNHETCEEILWSDILNLDSS